MIITSKETFWFPWIPTHYLTSMTMDYQAHFTHWKKKKRPHCVINRQAAMILMSTVKSKLSDMG